MEVITCFAKGQAVRVYARKATPQLDCAAGLLTILAKLTGRQKLGCCIWKAGGSKPAVYTPVALVQEVAV